MGAIVVAICLFFITLIEWKTHNDLLERIEDLEQRLEDLERKQKA